MKRVFKWLLILLIIVVMVVLILHIPGYALLQFKQHSIAAPLWLVILVLLALALMWWLIKRIVLGAVHLPHQIKRLFENRAVKKRDNLVVDAFTRWVEHDWYHSAQAFMQLAKADFHPALCWLMAARASELAGLVAQQCDYLNHASALQLETLPTLAQADTYIQHGQISKAAALLDGLKDTPAVQLRQLSVAQAQHDLPKILALLPKLHKAKLLSDDQVSAKTQQAYSHVLKQTLNAAQCQSYWQDIPRREQHNRALLATYAHMMILHGQPQAVAKLLHQALQHQWDLELFVLYACVPQTAKQHLAITEQYQDQAGNDYRTLLALALIAWQHELYGKAKSYLDLSLSKRHTTLGTWLKDLTAFPVEQQKRWYHFACLFLLQSP
jgi:HemY protein